MVEKEGEERRAGREEKHEEGGRVVVRGGTALTGVSMRLRRYVCPCHV